MAIYDAKRSLPGGQPGPWGEPVSIRYDQRDVLLYAVGIGVGDLRFVYEKHPDFAVFPTFPIRWGSAGVPIDPALVPPSPGPLGSGLVAMKCAPAETRRMALVNCSRSKLPSPNTT